MSSFGCQQILINSDPELRAILEFLCGESNKLHNCGTYLARQLFFKTGNIPSAYDLHKELKNNSHFQAMYSQVSQQCLTTVAESFKSYRALIKAYCEGKLEDKPDVPHYRKPGFNLITFPKVAVKLKGNFLRFPLGTMVKVWFGLDSFCLSMPSNLSFNSIREFRILPRNGAFYLELIYKIESIKTDLDSSNVLGIDHGINNWLTCVSNVGTSFIVDGLHLKSLNQWYNKRVSILKKNQPQGFWSKQLANLTEKRNRQMRDAVNKAARIVINHCLDNNIGTIVFGWNKGQKDSINMGAKTNQKFVQIPTGKLKERISQLCERYGIRFEETEESYTSKASFLDNDVLPKFGEKPEQWQSSGKRVKRGLFKTAQNLLINADANGSSNIIKKVAVKLRLNLNGISRGALIAPFRIRLWISNESPSLNNMSLTSVV